MKATTILVTATGTAAAHSVLQTLRRQDALAVRLLGTDTNAEDLVAGSYLCDHFEQVPRFDDLDYLPTLLDLCACERVDILIPIQDGEVEVAARTQNELDRRGILTLLPPLEIVEACCDKRLTYDLLRRHNVPTPATWLPDELEQVGGPPAWPVIVKPRRGSGSAEVYRADNPAELAVFLRRVPDPIIQEYLPGEEYTVDVLADGDGHILATVPRLRLQTKAGVSTKGRTVYDEELIERTNRLCLALGMRGPANVQWRRDGRRLGCFEINPRLSGGLALTIAAGPNIPLMLVRLCLGEAVAPSGFCAGMTMVRSWSERFICEDQPVGATSLDGQILLSERF